MDTSTNRYASRYISDDENTSDLAVKVTKIAIEKAGIQPEKIGFIIVATMSPDYISPSVACVVQSQINATNAFAFDVNAACSGFVYALSVGSQPMNSGQYDYGLVIGAEVMSKLLDWSNRSSTILFGDGASCVILQRHHQTLIETVQMGSDGTKYACLTAHPLLVNNPFVQRDSQYPNTLEMDGRAIFNFATRKVPQLISDMLAQANLQSDDIDYYLCHRANARMI